MDITQRFGTNASVTGGVLSIELTDLATVGLDAASPSADQIFAALILLNLANQPVGAADDISVGVTVEAGFKSFLDRNGTTQLERQYTCSLYTPDTTGDIDPDDVV